jgi:ABC-2 type transport system permease protein
MTMWRDQARALFHRDLLMETRYRWLLAFDLFEVVLLLLSYVFLARVFGDRQPDGFAPLSFLLTGIAVSGSVTTAITCLAIGVRAQQQSSTLKALLVLPISPRRLTMLSAIYPIARAGLQLAVLLLVGAALGLPLGRTNVPALLVAFVLSVGSVLGFGLLSAAFAVVFKRGDPVLWTFHTAAWLLSGVLYPTSVLPPVFARLAELLPTTHALRMIRAVILEGATLGDVAVPAAVLAAFSVIGIPLGLWVFDRAVAYSKRVGTLGHQ